MHWATQTSVYLLSVLEETDAAGAVGALGAVAGLASLLEEVEGSVAAPDDFPDSLLVPESLLDLLSLSPDEDGFVWL
jgi:hypothetical protein